MPLKTSAKPQIHDNTIVICGLTVLDVSKKFSTHHGNACQVRIYGKVDPVASNNVTLTIPLSWPMKCDIFF